MDRSCETCKHSVPSTERGLTPRERVSNARCALSGKPPLYCLSERGRYGQCGPAGKKWEASLSPVIGAGANVTTDYGCDFAMSPDHATTRGGPLGNKYFVGDARSLSEAPETAEGQGALNARSAGNVPKDTRQTVRWKGPDGLIRETTYTPGEVWSSEPWDIANAHIARQKAEGNEMIEAARNRVMREMLDQMPMGKKPQ